MGYKQNKTKEVNKDKRFFAQSEGIPNKQPQVFSES